MLRGNNMATRKKKKSTENNVAGMLPTKELKGILTEEMSPEAKILKLGIILGGGIDINPYQIGHHLKMHPAEVHSGLTELKHRKEIAPGTSRDTVNIRRS